jgi:hypothetical protein
MCSFNSLGQLNYSTDFDVANASPGEGQWDNTGFNGVTTNACSGISMEDNCWGTGTSQIVEMSNGTSLGSSLGNLTTVTFDYKLLEYNSTTATPASAFNELVVYASSTGLAGSWVPIYSLNTHIESTNCATQTFTFTPSIGTLFLQFTVEHSGVSSPDFDVFIDNLSVIETLCAGTKPSATITTANLDCNTNTFDIDISGLDNGSFASTDIYIDGVLDIAGSELTGKTAGDLYTVTLDPLGGTAECNSVYNNITAACVTPCGGNPTVITDGYTESNITTPGSGGADDWLSEAESCGSASATEFEDSDVKLYSYTTGTNAGESFYFTIEYDQATDESHSIGVWENCINDSLTDCVTTYYNFDDISGVCVQGLLANTTYYIGVSNNYFNREDLDFDIIDFTVETSATVPDDECNSASIMEIDAPYDGSTRCSYTASASSPSGCGNIENDSWIEFVAGETEVVIDYAVKNCSAGNGVQLSAFSGTCGSLTLLAGSCLNYASNNSTGTWTFSGLTIGESYYIRADGYANDLCSYSYDPVSGILPVRVSYFDGQALSNGYNRIEWQTSSEINTDYFVLEKSRNGIDYDIFSKHLAAGNSSENIDYFTYDNNPFETTYYRLKQFDLDGTLTYTNDLVILNKEVKDELSVGPNPSYDGLINIRSSQVIKQINVLNSSGKLVKTINYDNQKTISLNLSEFNSNVYFLQIVKNNETILKKIVLF